MISAFPPFQVRFKPIKNISKEVFQNVIFSEIGKNNLRIDTDTFRSYNFLKDHTRHRKVKHHRGQFQNPATGAHTNYAESWHSLIRWNLNRYRMISEEYLMNYLAEFAYKAKFEKSEEGLLKLCVG